MRPALHDCKPGDLIEYRGNVHKPVRGIVIDETTDRAIWFRELGGTNVRRTSRYMDVYLIDRNAYDLGSLDD